MARVAHRYVGLALSVFLLVAGLTGTLLVFYHELDAALLPELHLVRESMPPTRALDPLELRQRLQQQLPMGLQALEVPLRREPGHAASFFVEVPPASAHADDEYFLNPFTGDVLGSRRWGDLGQGVVNLMPFVFRLHYSLGLSQVGTTLMGVVALLWTIDCFVGAYLTFPASARAHSAVQRRSWLARWKPAWLLRTEKLFGLVFTWHRASGLWVWGMLLVFAWSAVGLNLSQVYNPVMQATLGLEERSFERLPKASIPKSAPGVSFEQALELGRRHADEQAQRHGFAILAERRLAYDKEIGMYRYQVQSTRDISERYPGTTLWFDADTGRLTALDLPTGTTAGNTLTTWINHLHFGSVTMGGWPYRLFVAAMGLLVALLSITGGWIWLAKRGKRPLKLRAAVSSAPVANTAH